MLSILACFQRLDSLAELFTGEAVLVWALLLSQPVLWPAKRDGKSRPSRAPLTIRAPQSRSLALHLTERLYVNAITSALRQIIDVLAKRAGDINGKELGV